LKPRGWRTFAPLGRKDSPSSEARVRAYIRDQETHHRRVAFQDGFGEFLRRHGVPFDERYVRD
jgi:hypothetical protein